MVTVGGGGDGDEVADGEREIAPMIQDNGDRGLDSFKETESREGIGSPDSNQQVGQFSTFQREKKTLKAVPKVIVEDGFERYDHNYEDPGSRKGRIARQLSSTDRESRV